MNAIRKTLRKLGADRRGATAIEYGLIVALIALGMMGGLSVLGNSSDGMWGNLSTKVEDNM